MSIAEFNYTLRDFVDRLVREGHDLDAISRALKAEAFRVSLIESETHQAAALDEPDDAGGNGPERGMKH